MRDAIRSFGDKLLENRGVGLFYFAGHGIQSNGRNYLIPVDADIQKEYDIEDQAIAADMVLQMMELYKNTVNIVIMDACRNNPYSRGFRSAVQGLAPISITPNRINNSLFYRTRTNRFGRRGKKWFVHSRVGQINEKRGIEFGRGF